RAVDTPAAAGTAAGDIPVAADNPLAADNPVAAEPRARPAAYDSDRRGCSRRLTVPRPAADDGARLRVQATGSARDNPRDGQTRGRRGARGCAARRRAPPRD